jgi:hypothetical protein
MVVYECTSDAWMLYTDLKSLKLYRDCKYSKPGGAHNLILNVDVDKR